MTQITVNFLTLDTIGQLYETQGRIFDFEITPDAQAFYNYEMYQILLAMHAQVKDASGTLTDVSTLGQNGTMAALAGGAQVVFSGTAPSAAEMQTATDAIQRLNAWSQSRYINSDGFQTYNIGIPNFQQGGIGPVLTDANGYILTDSFGNLLGIPLDSAGNPIPPTFTDGNDPSEFIAAGVTAGKLTSTMDQYMAQSLDQLIRTFRSAGWDPISGLAPSGSPGDQGAAFASVTGAASQQIYNLGAILQKAVSAASQAHLVGAAAATDSMSIQQVLMVDYVSRGNEILFNQMAQLKDAIDMNQMVLSYLNSLQDLMNQKDPQQFIMALQQLNNVQTNTQNPQSQFDSFENLTFNQTLGTLAKFQFDGNTGPGSLGDYLTQLANQTNGTPLADGAGNQLDPTAVVQAGDFSKQRIIDNLNYLASQIQAKGGSAGNALITSLNKIRSDIEGVASLADWVQDTQQGDQGAFQRDLGNAIVSSQSFNDTQRENLREVMFVFEEFYKSATGLLSRLTQLIEKMADGIAR